MSRYGIIETTFAGYYTHCNSEIQKRAISKLDISFRANLENLLKLHNKTKRQGN